MNGQDLGRFDWYTATLEGRPDSLQDALRSRLGADREGFRTPRHGYHSRELWRAPTGLEVDIQHGGSNPGGVCATATGAWAAPFAALVRELAPDHRVTRADVAIDWTEPDGYDRWKPVLRQIADEQRVQHVREVHDDGRGHDGRTYYLGSPASVVRVRMYEKGLQQLAEGRRTGVLPILAEEWLDEGRSIVDWMRLEIVVRPDGRDAKAAMAKVEPGAFWGCSRWSRVLADRVMDAKLERLRVGSVRKASDDDRMLRSMVRQYRHVLERLRDASGWEGVGTRIGELCSQLDAEADAVRRVQRRQG